MLIGGTLAVAASAVPPAATASITISNSLAIKPALALVSQVEAVRLIRQLQRWVEPTP